MDDINKNIDESWKEAVEKEKKKEESFGEKQQEDEIEVNFISFVTSLSLQVLIALGEIENPLTAKKEDNLIQAKIIIDTLDLLKEKTKNNLTKQESDLLENILYELKMKYVTKQGRD